jgi:hypothetical protein
MKTKFILKESFNLLLFLIIFICWLPLMIISLIASLFKWNMEFAESSAVYLEHIIELLIH